MVDMSALYEGISDANGAKDVARLQNRLIEMGYMDGGYDGIYGKSTANAVRFFQKVNGLPVTGVADYDTLVKLYSDDAVVNPEPTPTPLAKSVKGDEVQQLQHALALYGFLDGAADGSFGDKTETAVKEAQAYYYQLMQATVTPTPAATKAWMTPTPTPTFAPTPELTASPDGTAVAPAATKQPTPTPTIRFAPEPTPYAPDGVVSEELLAWLHGGTFDVYQATAQRGDKTAEAMRVQRRLVYLGYMRKADGNFGPATERCLVYFQKLNGLKQTGVADETTQRRLFSESAVKSDIIVTQYRITIDLNKQRVYVYEWNGSNFDNKIKEFKCSTGKDETPTPKGEFWNTAPLTEWWYFKEFDCWAKYAWTIDGGIFFHSEIYSAKDDRTVRSNTIKQLGRKASHGCVRLYRDNAKWIFDNCPAGTPVTVK